jgi:tRNA pseudouridine13 synthase
MSLGDLSGNRFSVALRFIERAIPDETLRQKVNLISKHGFINYFGMQRFGSYNIHTHEIGRECLRQNWGKVVQ